MSSGFHGYESPSNSSITTPSPCSSEDDIPSAFEYRHDEITWPWMDGIEGNGDLIYIDSYHLQEKEEYGTPKEIERNGGIERKLRNGTTPVGSSKCSSYTKSSGYSSWKSSSSLKSSLQEIFSKNDKSELLPVPCIYPNGHAKKQSPDSSSLVYRNVVLKLDSLIEKDFLNLENVLGIISGLGIGAIGDPNNDNISANSINNNNAIIVQGLIPHSPASKCRDIFMDDVIVAINGVTVHFGNIDDILNRVNGLSEIVLKVKRIEPGNDGDTSEFCALVSNEIWEGRNQLFQAFGEMCAVMYLTLDASEDISESDVIFCYPKSPLIDKLKNARGMFLTLNDIMNNVTGTNVECSVLLIDGKELNVCYQGFNSDVFVVAIPCEMCSKNNLKKKTLFFLQILEILYGDIPAAFLSDKLESMKHLIYKYTDILLQDTDNEQIIGMKQVQLPLHQYCDISTLLTDGESSDYGECANDFFPHQRLYVTLGICLFYKNSLVCNHLSDNLLQIVINFCTFHWLFALVKRETLNQLIIWKELLLKKHMDHSGMDFLDDNETRWFLLIVGQGKSLLCTLLQTGGVASSPEGFPGPHPFYVDTAWSILKYLLEVLEVEDTCKKLLAGMSLPAVLPAVQIINKTAQSPTAFELTKRKIAVGTDAYNRLNSQSELLITPGCDSSESSSNSGNNFPVNDFDVLDVYHGYEPPSATSLNLGHPMTTTLSTKLTAGNSNCLFTFLVVPSYSGIIISPNYYDIKDPYSSTLMTSFKESCEMIHEMFSDSSSVEPLLEFGILLHLESTQGAEMKKASPNVRYWVVGRQHVFGTCREMVYLCFEDGTPQNVIEMAYKMRFGCYY